MRPTRLHGRELINVAGESHYQDALRELTKGETRVGATAALIPEPDNPHDPDAVRVEIEGQKVGYLPRDLAPGYGPLVREPAERDRTAVCEAMISGRDGVYGVFLKLPSVEVD